MSIQAKQELTLREVARLWETPPVTLTTILVAEIEGLPPLKLKLDVTNEARVDLAAKVQDSIDARSQFTVDGTYKICKSGTDCNIL
jgi:hypothetical protein